jgi:RNA polymerase sigma-70 factor (ECF subfamily)
VALQKTEERRQVTDWDPVGPEAAFFRRALHRYLVRRLGNQQDAHDLAQEAYLRYLQGPGAAALRKPTGYLFRIAANLTVEWRTRRNHSTVTFDSELADKRSSAWADASADVCEQLTTRDELEKILEQIPLNYRRVLIMSKGEGLHYLEIAERLKLAPDTVLTYLARAIAAARRAHFD